jgi:hypothetical protein
MLSIFCKNSKGSLQYRVFYHWQYQTAYDGDIHECRQLLNGTRHSSRVVSALTDSEVFKFSFILYTAHFKTRAF